MRLESPCRLCDRKNVSKNIEESASSCITTCVPLACYQQFLRAPTLTGMPKDGQCAICHAPLIDGDITYCSACVKRVEVRIAQTGVYAPKFPNHNHKEKKVCVACHDRMADHGQWCSKCYRKRFYQP